MGAVKRNYFLGFIYWVSNVDGLAADEKSKWRKIKFIESVCIFIYFMNLKKGPEKMFI